MGIIIKEPLHFCYWKQMKTVGEVAFRNFLSHTRHVSENEKKIVKNRIVKILKICNKSLWLLLKV